MIRVFRIENIQEWKYYIKKCDNYDFYHTWNYHKICSDNNQGDPELIVMEEDCELIVFPLLKREIKDEFGRHQGFDYSSVYGYVGPIVGGEIGAKTIVKFQDLFKNHCRENNIVSVFSRLHPTLNQERIISSIGLVEENCKTINIDLTKTLEEQRRQYRKSNKSEINKLRKESVVFWSENNSRDLEEFVEIYEETMNRVNAHERYFFKKEYYESLFNNDEFETKLLFVEYEGVKIAGALFVFCNNTIQYHLAGTRTSFMKINPMKLLLDEVRLFGKKEGYINFHLGGGISSSEEDPLFRF